MRRFVLTVAGCTLLPLLVRADQAVFSDGRQVEGTLRLQKPGSLSFVPGEQGRAVAITDVRSFRLAGPARPFFRAAPLSLLRLSDEEEVTGVFLGLERDRLLLRTAWAQRLSVPRAGPLSLTHLPGWRTLRHDELSARPPKSNVAGEPAFSADGLKLTRPGQALTYELERPVEEGRVGVNFHEQDEPDGARWVVELAFAAKTAERVVRVTLAGAGRELAVEPGGLKGTSQAVSRTGGVRRLTATFNKGSIRLLVDDSVLWYTLDEGPGGPLRKVRLACVGGDGKARGGVVLSALTLETETGWPRRPRGEPGRDELWLASGDQLFGDVVKADAGAIELKARFGTRRYPFNDLLGWYPRRVAVQPPNGVPAVRLEVYSGLRPAADVLLGTLISLDAKQATLRHAMLGEVTIPRSHIAGLRVLTPER